MAKKCPPGKYYCFDDKKCKKIPRGYHIGARGYLARDNRTDADDGGEDSNGNGNGGNGNGNGGGDGGGDGGGGMGESIVYETSNPRIPRKKGQPAGSKKHSDLYTDENPKGTIQGLGFKDVAKSKASVSKIRNSSRSHAHKIQAAVAMEQRAREMGKSSEAAVYRKYINSMKKKTKKMNEGMNNHPEFALITVAVDELEKGLMELGAITYSSVDELMQGIAKRNSISPTLLHNQFKTKHLTIPDNWAIRKRMNKMKGIEEATMTPAQKRKDTMLKKKYDKSDMKKSMQKQYGKEEGKKVYFATIRKQAMKKEEYISELSGKTLQSYKDKVAAQLEKRLDGLNMANRKIQDKKVTPPPRARIDESMEALIHHFKIFTEGFKVPAGEIYTAVESPRGELGCYIVSDGGPKPYRMHIRGPSFTNLQVLPHMLQDCLVADAVAVISTVDPIMGEVDR